MGIYRGNGIFNGMYVRYGYISGCAASPYLMVYTLMYVLLNAPLLTAYYYWPLCGC
jgi:hypothetical protein